MLKKLLMRLLEKKTPFNPRTEIPEPSGCVGEPVGGKNWYKPKQRKITVVRDPGAPQHVSD